MAGPPSPCLGEQTESQSLKQVNPTTGTEGVSTCFQTWLCLGVTWEVVTPLSAQAVPRTTLWEAGGGRGA